MPGAPLEVLKQIPLFADLNKRELSQVARLFKERRFAPGETVAKEGAGGAAFFFISSGEASVSVHGEFRRALSAGDYFGEIALIDGGPRSATVTADSELACYGLTFWDFRPLVQDSAAISWKLLQSLAKKLRAAEEVAPAD
jgi:CRP-like cAMP-binding protein